MPLGMIGKYERLDVLGHGVSGIVYLAKDTLLNKQVALKEVDVQAGDLRRFLEEARVMDRLRHPNIVRVNNVDRIEGKVVIDMEYVRGQNLQEMLRQEGPLPVERACAIAAQVLDALDYAHQMQTVHRDIKPANILIGRDGQVKLVDFGLAEILATNAYAGGAGTYAYMAPEDFAEDDRSDHQSDIWAVGVTLFEMLTSQRPFNVLKVKDPFAWKRTLETETPTPLAEYLPDGPQIAALQAILDRALARDKRRRYASAGEFRDDLKHLQAGEALSPLTHRQSSKRSPILRRFGNTPAPTSPANSPAMDVFDSVSPLPNNFANTPSNSLQPDPTMQEEAVPWWNKEDGQTEEEAATNRQSPIHNPQSPLDYQPADRVVADVNVRGKARGARLPFAKRNLAQKLVVEPGRVDFGTVRKGELASVKIMARVIGADGEVEGRIVHAADWLTVHPPAFDRARQSITLTAHSARVWETGAFNEMVHVETNAGTVDVPVRLIVLQPRPSFLQIALWYAPLFGIALLPALAVALGNNGLHPHTPEFIAGYVPSAALVSGLLSLMLLLVGVAADIGIGERIACGVLIALMGAILGLSTAQLGHPPLDPTQAGRHAIILDHALQRAFVAGGFLGGILLLQLLHLRKWKLWAFVVGALGLGIGGALLKILSS